MLRLIRMELRKAFRGGWFFAALAVACAIALSSAARSIWAFHAYGFDAFDASQYHQLSTSGAICAWIGIGRIDTTFLPWLFFGLAPLLAVIPYAWSYRSEVASGYVGQVLCRASRAKYMAAKCLAVFCTAGAAIALPLALNYFVVSLFIPGYIPDAGEGLSVPIDEHCPFSILFFSHPTAYFIVYTIFDFILCGSWGVFVLALSFFVRNRVVLLAGSYVFQYFLHFVNVSGLSERVFGPVGVYQFNLISMVWPVPFGDVPNAALSLALACAALGFFAVSCALWTRRDVV